MLAFSDRGRNISLSSFGEEAEAVPGGDAVGKIKKLWNGVENPVFNPGKMGRMTRRGSALVAEDHSDFFFFFLRRVFGRPPFFPQRESVS